MSQIINKTMDRSDLLTSDAKPIVQRINDLINTLYSRNLYMTSWYGTLPKEERIKQTKHGIKDIINKLYRKAEYKQRVGIDNRGSTYKPLSNVADDNRIPWYLYWEIYWVMKNGPQVNNDMKLLDAGGTSSSFTCYLGSLGVEVDSIDLNEKLVSNGNKISKIMGWKILSYAMNMKKLDFEDEYFNHAYSICVFEHLEYKIKQSAISEIARCLKPNGILSITFDYRNLAPFIMEYGPCTNNINQLKTIDDIKRNFLSTGHFEFFGNQEFYDNGKSYLVHPQFSNAPYTFGAIF